MELKFSLNPKNYKEISKKFESLKNSKHLRIMLILEGNEKTSDDIHHVMKTENHYKHRENTYQALEKLVKTGMINKKYDTKRKRIVYYVALSST